MRVEAADGGVYTRGRNESYPRLLPLTVADLLDNKSVAYPGWSRNTTYRSVPQVSPHGAQARQHPFGQQDGQSGSPATPL